MILAFEYDNELKFYNWSERESARLAEVEGRNYARMIGKPDRFDLFLVRRLDADDGELHSVFLTREEAEQEARDIGRCRVTRGTFVGSKAILNANCLECL